MCNLEMGCLIVLEMYCSSLLCSNLLEIFVLVCLIIWDDVIILQFLVLVCICLKLYLTLGACAGGLQYLDCVCVSVCLSVRTISAIPLDKTPQKGHHKNQRPMGKILKKAF